MRPWTRQIDLRRCARGRIVDAGEATNTTIALFNNDASSQLILVWQFSADGAQVAQSQFSYQQIHPMANLGTVQALVPGDGPPPGLLTSGDQPTVFTPDFIPLPL